MPKSKVRKKDDGPVRPAAAPLYKPSPTWYPILLIAVLIVGLAYIVVYYLAGDKVGFMNALGAWNFAVGFGFMLVGLGMAVRWR